MYRHDTSPTVGNCMGGVSVNGRCEACGQQPHVTGCDNASSVYGGGQVIQITVIKTADPIQEELFEEKEEPIRVPYRPQVKPVKDAWRSKWRLRQQRPRDGLR